MASSPIPSTSPNHAPFIPNRLICFITLPPPLLHLLLHSRLAERLEGMVIGKNGGAIRDEGFTVWGSGRDWG
ncbi:uncharacterized protein G2W53_000034 [Senna tora]|uniref:Uncharacterized protein n=1 Tax=Senna tora TaxID=362788 RepID=A0A834XDB1_9FABA|nr:uncharacterized protein G2W53_000034 [Senna tora]